MVIMSLMNGFGERERLCYSLLCKRECCLSVYKVTEVMGAR